VIARSQSSIGLSTRSRHGESERLELERPSLIRPRAREQQPDKATHPAAAARNLGGQTPKSRCTLGNNAVTSRSRLLLSSTSPLRCCPVTTTRTRMNIQMYCRAQESGAQSTRTCRRTPSSVTTLPTVRQRITRLEAFHLEDYQSKMAVLSRFSPKMTLQHTTVRTPTMVPWVIMVRSFGLCRFLEPHQWQDRVQPVRFAGLLWLKVLFAGLL
jgi:hypothetical protein